ncbi:sugar phosphate isomerase/epimerase [Candidatus Woesearchaeota archaeon]|nr:sugar phosphate isomerase/epimerase [Candidatus Woesearchaeota archaeon]
MVTFSSYTTPMQRDYGKPAPDDISTNDAGVGVGDIGMSVPMGISAANVQGISAKLRQGANALEIAFPGAVRGTRQAHTPGMYGEDQREAMRELAKINEVKLTTHASYGIMGLAGMDQQGNFSKEQRKLAVDEIKRAVEFAADTALGGSVVVHTGEFQRPISEEAWAKNPDGTFKFLGHKEEPERAIIRVVDDRTGQVIQQVRKNQKVARPIWNKYEERNKEYWDEKSGKSYTDANGNKVNSGDYIDYEGNKIDIKNRVPVYDTTTGRFKVELYEWKDFIREAEERNKIKSQELGIPVEQLSEYERMLPEEAFLKATLETNEGHSRGWAGYYAQGFDKAKENLAKLRKSLEYYKKVEAATPEEDMWKLRRRFGEETGLVPPEYKLPSEILEEQLTSAGRRMEFEHQASTSQQQQAEDSFETQQHVLSARKYALKESFRSYAESGIHAMDTTRSKGLEKPVFVTMENIFPESYGSHPDELKNLVLESRETMAEMLHEKRNVSMEEARQLAETHIKATLDTGHLNTWRKYWQNDSNKSLKENDDDFKQWLLQKTEELAKEQIIGNVHLADNYGYQDDHLAPGMGTTPVKEMTAILRKYGYKGALTVEPGADASTDLGDFWGLMKTWRLFGSPVYGAHGPVSRSVLDSPKPSWADIQYSYFGQTKPPYYVFGPYSPSQDWTLWTQVPLE